MLGDLYIKMHIYESIHARTAMEWQCAVRPCAAACAAAADLGDELAARELQVLARAVG